MAYNIIYCVIYYLIFVYSVMLYNCLKLSKVRTNHNNLIPDIGIASGPLTNEPAWQYILGTE